MEWFNVALSLKAADLLKGATGMQDFSRLAHISHYVLETQHLKGDIVEFGCNKGNTIKLISILTQKIIHAYDSFEGLPAGEHVGEGGQMSTTEQVLIDNFQRDGIRLPLIHKGWFSDLKDQDIPGEISFAHIDSDMYISTIQALNLVYDNLVSGAVVLIDDYDAPICPGVRQALEEFLSNKPEEIIALKGLNNEPSYKVALHKI